MPTQRVRIQGYIDGRYNAHGYNDAELKDMEWLVDGMPDDSDQATWRKFVVEAYVEIPGGRDGGGMTIAERLADIKSRYPDYKGRPRPGNLKNADIEWLFSQVESRLANNPADDEIPICDMWLRSVGFVRLMQTASDNHLSLGHPADAKFINARKGARDKFRTWHVGGEVLPLAMQPKTRGDVRRVAKALGITLEQPK